MSFHLLQPHGGPSANPGVSIEVELAPLSPSKETLSAGFCLTYIFKGSIENILWPAENTRLSPEHLWRSTCVEAFVLYDKGPQYHEFNAAPGIPQYTQQYFFGDYRRLEGPGPRWEMRVGDMCTPTPDVARVQVEFQPHTGIQHQLKPEKLGISVILQHKRHPEKLSYFALHHAKDTPDFHCQQSFVLPLRV